MRVRVSLSECESEYESECESASEYVCVCVFQYSAPLAKQTSQRRKQWERQPLAIGMASHVLL